MTQDFEPTYELLDYCERTYGAAMGENERWHFFGAAKSRLEKMTEFEKSVARQSAFNQAANQRITKAKLNREYSRYLSALFGDQGEIPAINENKLACEIERELIAKWSEITLTHQAML